MRDKIGGSHIHGHDKSIFSPFPLKNYFFECEVKKKFSDKKNSEYTLKTGLKVSLSRNRLIYLHRNRRQQPTCKLPDTLI